MRHNKRGKKHNVPRGKVPAGTFLSTKMPNLDPWYVTGFCDGEAAFTYSRAGGSLGLYFAIKQREDNRQIVEELHQFFGSVGHIYKGKEAGPNNKNSGLTKASSYFRVTKISELKAIVDHFDKYPLQSAKKREAYQVWREMVVHKFEHYRSSNYDLLRSLAGKLSSLNIQSRAFRKHSR